MSHRPLAGRPPWATDDPDELFDLPAQPRPQPSPVNSRSQPADSRESAYGAYDHYFEDEDTRRHSGAGAVGMGLLNGMLDDDSSDESDYGTQAASTPTQPSHPPVPPKSLRTVAPVSPARPPQPTARPRSPQRPSPPQNKPFSPPSSNPQPKAPPPPDARDNFGVPPKSMGGRREGFTKPAHISVPRRPEGDSLRQPARGPPSSEGRPPPGMTDRGGPSRGPGGMDRTPPPYGRGPPSSDRAPPLSKRLPSPPENRPPPVDNRRPLDGPFSPGADRRLPPNIRSPPPDANMPPRDQGLPPPPENRPPPVDNRRPFDGRLSPDADRRPPLNPRLPPPDANISPRDRREPPPLDINIPPRSASARDPSMPTRPPGLEHERQILPPQAAFMAPPASGDMQPLTPITPVFARPNPSTLRVPPSAQLKFSDDAILRGNSEETLLSRHTEKGDEFWRRFSMVAREANSKPPGNNKSWWLRESESGRMRMSIWIWFISITLLIVIGGGVAAAWYFTRNSSSHTAPEAIGGSADEGFTSVIAAAVTTTTKKAKATSTPAVKRHVNDYVERVVMNAMNRDVNAERMRRLRRRENHVRPA